MKIPVFSLQWGFFLAFLLIGPVNAAEGLAFNKAPGTLSQKNLDRYLQASLNKNSMDYAIAPVDLNGDGLEEFILHEKTCPSEQNCPFTVLAENDGKIIQLGEIRARRLALANQVSSGVRNLLAYENGANDYDYTVYRWEPNQSRYMIGRKE